ncbi:hypothetical protein CVT26_016056 [Gymnopilus dilepis]|uniref:Uncharacterized protein n=1 Tax=Gymnopilus dilepis TaxID=231916 RepID=A0A409YDT9_9AGAR|nr:hypothetical protein CVT26_016056 [Gymnopilus dilepis]
MSEAPSSSRSQIQDDVDKERQASTMRLLETWASLEQRYARPLDEDDIIDIQTGEIVRDNGFLRNSGKRDFGSFAASVDGGAAADDSSDVYEEEEDEYDDDELDLFADVNQEPAESESREQRIAEYLGGIRPPSSSFALDDLQEFLEAERRRKQIYGSDLDDDDEDDNTGYYSAEEARSDVVADSGSRSAYEEEGEEDEVVEAGEEEAENESAEVEAEEDEDDFTANSALLPDLPSEDELDNWDLGEASLVVPVVKDEPADNMEESDVEIELIENPEPPSPVLTAIGTRGKRNKSVQPHSEPLQEPSRRPPLRQLYTPPQSHDSTTPSSDNFIDLSVDSPPTKSSSKASKSSNKKISIVNAVESSSKSPPTRSPEIPPAKPSPTRMHKLKPYVLLTPRKFLDKEKEHVGASPTKDVKRKGKAKEVDESRSETAVPDVDVERPSSRALPVGPPRGKSRRPQQESSRETRDSVAMPPPPPPKTPKQKKESTPSAKGVSKSQEPSPAKAQKSQTGDVFDKARHERPQRATSTIRQQTPSPRKRKRSMTPDVISSSTSRGRSREANNATEPAFPPSRASTSKVQLDSSPASTSQSPTKKRRSSRGRQSHVESGSNSSDSEAEDVPRPGDRHPPARGSSFPVPHPHYAYPFPPYYHPHHPPPEYPPYPNLQAQQIIQNAVQQLSAALLGSAWPPPPGFAPPPAQQTPSRGRHSSRRPDDPFTTPTHHPHPFPYIYDPTLSHATEPPESPEVDSSPEMSVSGRRKSLVRRSRSRGRRVSFVVEDEEMEIQSSPVGLQASRRAGSKRLHRQTVHIILKAMRKRKWKDHEGTTGEHKRLVRGLVHPLAGRNTRGHKRLVRIRRPAVHRNRDAAQTHAKDRLKAFPQYLICCTFI